MKVMDDKSLHWKNSYEAARQELLRAEELLKQRHVNTKKILEKQKVLSGDLLKEKGKRQEAEKKNVKLTKYVVILHIMYMIRMNLNLFICVSVGKTVRLKGR
jgi:hypothetical protein